ncbi:MAG: ArsR family transcriptional regulator [Candidatus Odinarchaeota archaeon]|nr:ArsR family transcriptional regulator [Candidatus Odinarchaeota archaeon]
MSDLDKVLKGKTLKIYLLLLKKGTPMRVREIQRELKLSTPSLVSYHLSKLNELGVVSKTENDLYYASNLVKSTYLVDFIKVKGLILPRFLFYSIFSTAGLIMLLTVFMPSTITSSFVFAVIIMALSTIFMWSETYRFWRRYFES